MKIAQVRETLEEIQRIERLVEDAPTVEEAAKHAQVMARVVGEVVAAAARASNADRRAAWRHAADAALALDSAVTVVRERTRG